MIEGDAVVHEVRYAADGSQRPIATVFVRRDGRIHHFWSSELLFGPPDPGQHNRQVDFMWPPWSVLDCTLEGRGTDFGPELVYERRRLASHGLSQLMLLTESLAQAVPDGSPDDHAAVADAFAVGEYYIRRSAIGPAEVPLVIGAGRSGCRRGRPAAAGRDADHCRRLERVASRDGEGPRCRSALCRVRASQSVAAHLGFPSARPRATADRSSRCGGYHAVQDACHGFLSPFAFSMSRS